MTGDTYLVTDGSLLEPARASQCCSSPPNTTFRCHIASLRLALLGVFTLWKWAETTNLAFLRRWKESWRILTGAQLDVIYRSQSSSGFSKNLRSKWVPGPKILLIIKELLLITLLCKPNTKAHADRGSKQIFSQVLRL